MNFDKQINLCKTYYQNITTLNSPESSFISLFRSISPVPSKKKKPSFVFTRYLCSSLYEQNHTLLYSSESSFLSMSIRFIHVVRCISSPFLYLSNSIIYLSVSLLVDTSVVSKLWTIMNKIPMSSLEQVFF